MAASPASAVEDSDDEIATLVCRFHDTEQRLLELAGGEVDAVAHPGGQPYLLRPAQEKLRQREAAQRGFAVTQSSMLNALPAHIALLDDRGVIVSVNDRWRDFAGSNSLESSACGLGENYLEICERAEGRCAEEAHEAAAGMRAVMAGTAPRFSLEYPCHSPTERRWFRLMVSPTETVGVGGAVVMHVDITERKQSEEALAELSRKMQRRERMLTTMLSSLSDFAYIFDREGRFLFANQPLLDLWGITLEEAEGKNFFDLGYPEEVAAKLQRQVQEVFETMESVTDETSYPSPAGLTGCYEYIFSPAFAADGAVDFVVGSTRDITERKQAELEVRFREERYRSLVEATTAIVWDTPASGEFEDEQPSWAAFTGQTFEEYHGWGWLEAIHPDDQAETERAWSDALSNHAIYTLEHRLRAWNQIYRSMMVRAVPILAEDGKVQQWIGVHTDITERKSLEQQFLRAQRMESIGTLAGGIAHDLNNALAPIIMSLSVLEKRHPDRRAQGLLAIVEASAQRAADMVRQVLSFARGVEGRRMELSVKHLVQEIEQIACDTFLKHIEVRSSVPHDLWTVQGDPTQLHQVLLNLCVNARDAMPSGGRLALSAENVTLDAHYAVMNLDALPGPYVLIQVEDTGTGMPPAVIEKIFDPFFTTKEVGKGTGLGLSTSLGIVKSHGGFIRVSSEPGKGTKFRVYLPAQTEVSRETAAAPQQGLPYGHGELILVVDDEASVRLITQQTLESFGYRAMVASDGAEAIAVYATHRAEIAALLTDMVMPGIDGVATIQALRKINPKLPIIAASGFSTDDQFARARNLDVKHFLTKPYTAATLLNVLQEILAEKR